MVKKLVTQIYNERGSNFGLLLELLVVSVVLWYVVDNLYCRYVTYTQPMGINIEHCYSISLGELKPEANGYVTYTQKDEERHADVWNLLNRISHRPEVEAAAVASFNSVPYSLGNSNTIFSYDTLKQSVRRLEASSDYFRVFRIQGGRGEKPEQLAELMETGLFMLSANVLDKYDLDVTSLIGKDNFHLYGNLDRNNRLSGTFQPIRPNEYVELNSDDSKSIFFIMGQSALYLGDSDCFVVRVRADQDHDFIERLTADAIIKYTGDLDSAKKKKLIEELSNFSTTGAERFIPLPFGMDITALDLKLTDSQFYELKKYSALQIASAFGIKPNHLNDYEKSSYANSEMQNLTFYVDTLLYIITLYEEEFNYKMLTEEERQKGYNFEINVATILRGDLKTQAESLARLVQASVYQVNEARSYLGMPKIEDGDTIMVNGSYVKLEEIGKAYSKYDNSKGGENNDTGKE